MTAARLPAGGRIDRARPIPFRFDGRDYSGFAGDSLASALLANDVAVVGRSFKRRRPRGLLALGAEEPNGILDLSQDGLPSPNRMAVETPLRPGLDARSTRGWPSARFDLGRLLDLWPAPIAAGFYYKTFIGPGLPGARDAWNRLWEPAIRRMAGQGVAPSAADPHRYEHVELHVDVAIVGAGLAGLAAARAAAAGGGRIAIFERDLLPGGRALACPEDATIEGKGAAAWAAGVWQSLERRPRTTARGRATAFGLYGAGHLAVFEDCPEDPAVQGRIWHVHAGRVVIATGALERPMVFPGNDRPGVMLAGAVEAAVRRYGVRPGRRAVLYANHEGLAGAEAALAAAGVAVVDRAAPGEAVVGTLGAGRLAAVDIAPFGRDGLPDGIARRRVAADLLVTSGGWSPALALHLSAGGRQRWSAEAGAFLPDGAGLAGASVVGAANGRFVLADAVRDGHVAGAAAVGCSLGTCPLSPPVVVGGGPGPVGQGLPLAPIRGRKAKARAYVDFQHDVTVADIELAAREGFVAIEHAKRFTTAGMATDQGRTGQVATAAALAAATGRDVAEVGLSGLRAPAFPVPFAALGGRRAGPLFRAVRKTPMHDRHVALGAVFEDVGDWKRARYYPRPGEGMRAAVARECRAVRRAAGVLDVSTLGKIEVSGPDAGQFLDRVYTNRMGNLAVGACRYGLMLKDDGMVFDDGVVARIDERRFHLTTTSGGAASVLDWLEDWRQTEWPDLRVRLASTTEQWAGIAIAGPEARQVMAALAPGLDLSGEAFPHMTWRAATVLGAAARVFRVSFSGERGYEINVPWSRGAALWEAALAAGAAPYGTEAMHVLRAEKGFIVVGHETDGTVTPLDLGMGWIVARKKGDFIGRRALERPAVQAPERKQLVGLLPEDPTVVLDEGAQIIEGERPAAKAAAARPMVGHVTSSYWSDTLGRGFALALLRDGAKRHGARLHAWSLGRSHPVVVTAPLFYDAEGKRLDG